MRLTAGVLATLLVLGTARGAPPPGRTAAVCDRACLEDIAERYATALAARDPARAPLSSHVRFTENGQVLNVGDALWGTAQMAGDYRVVVADAAEGTVGLFRVMRESGQPILLATRLTVVDRQITELETIVSRMEPGSESDPETLTRQPAFRARPRVRPGIFSTMPERAWAALPRPRMPCTCARRSTGPTASNWRLDESGMRRAKPRKERGR